MFKIKKYSMILCIVLSIVLLNSSITLACTVIAAGKDATADGSAIVAYNDDSGVGDVRLWIIPAKDWPEGSQKEILVDGHSYGDFGKYPYANFPAEELYGDGIVVGTMPEASHTYRYFHTRYSFANENGVVMGETTCTPNGSDYANEIKKTMGEEGGLIDMWFLMDVALQRATTAKEAVQIMGDVVEEYKWYGGMSPGSGECAAITDGNDVWIVEFYGSDLWAAVRLPDDQVFVSANRHRIREFDFDDKDNYMCAPNLKEFAIEKGWFDPNSNEGFSPADVYGPSNSKGSNVREWRALSLIAPSLDLKYDYSEPSYSPYPFSVAPDKKLTVDDVFKIQGDTLEGTAFDLTEGPGSGPYGNPIPARPNGARSINTKSNLFGHVSQVKGWLPDPIKAVSWFGYGARDTSYQIPLNPNMFELPKLFSTGSRYEDFTNDSGWWVNTQVMHLAEYCYDQAIQDIHAFRAPKQEMLYQTVPVIQDLAAKMYKKDPIKALNITHQFYYNTSIAMHEEWKDLSNMLLAKYNSNNPRKAVPAFPEWWTTLIYEDYPQE